jgi:CMP-N-acetylneuraminic acid synthetase
MKIIAVVPARSGSKRLPGKNIKPLGSKPLIAHSIEAGLDSRLIDRVIVSTDSQEIARIGKQYGAEVPFLRPPAISGDSISDTPVLGHVAEWLEDNENYSPDIIVLLRPTTPLRSQGLIDRCIERLLNTEADSVRSVRDVGHWHPYWMLTVDEQGWANPFLEGKTVDEFYQSQLLPQLYKHDGYCDVIRRKNIPRNCPPNATLAGLYGKKRQVEFNNNGPFINIDTHEEFEIAKYYKDRM